jgi:hypothetical protein
MIILLFFFCFSLRAVSVTNNDRPNELATFDGTYVPHPLEVSQDNCQIVAAFLFCSLTNYISRVKSTGNIDAYVPLEADRVIAGYDACHSVESKQTDVNSTLQTQ